VHAAAQGVHVVTTSGPATGSPALVSKVQVMRAALGDHALALASGITPENVRIYLPYVDAYLVASGIERSFGEFDPARLRALAELIHGHQPAGQ
jgi:predicted TIM-barrel enzyme